MRYHTTRRWGWLTWMAVLLLASSAWAKPGDGSELKGAMGGADDAAAEAAVEEAVIRMAEKKVKPVRDWFTALFKAKRYELAAELAGQGLIATLGGASGPGGEEQRDELVSRRAKALAKLPVETHGEAALGAAAAYYRLASPNRVGDAVEAVSEALAAVRGDEGERLARRWRLEQLAPREKGGRPVLHDLPQDPLSEAYATAAAQRQGGSYADLAARTNLLLLAGDGTAAAEAAERAYEVAPPERLKEATEAVARTMRARDGSVAGANAWLAELRAEAAVD